MSQARISSSIARDLRALAIAEKEVRRMNRHWKSGVSSGKIRTCKRGHRFTPANSILQLRNGKVHRACRKCRKITFTLRKLRRPVTNQVRAITSHCYRGHPRTKANLYLGPGGSRTCRKCRAISNRRYQERKRAENESQNLTPLERYDQLKNRPKRCMRGHRYNADTVGWNRHGGLFCVRCKRINARRWKQRYQEELADRRSQELAKAGIQLPRGDTPRDRSVRASAEAGASLAVRRRLED